MRNSKHEAERKAFEDQFFKTLKENNPKVVRERLIANAKRGRLVGGNLGIDVPPMTIQEIKDEFPIDKDHAEKQAAYVMWVSSAKFLEAFDVYCALGRNDSRYPTWRSRMKIAKRVSAVEAAWLLHYAETKNNRTDLHLPKPAKNLINPKHPVLDPFKEIRMRKAVSKIGKVAGKWKFVECLSLDTNPEEKTTNNAALLYKGVCIDCGFEDTINYRFALSKVCKRCSGKDKEALENVIVREHIRGKPQVIYRVDDGSPYGTVMVTKRGVVPWNATHRCTLDMFGAALAWEVIPEDMPREVNLSLNLAKTVQLQREALEDSRIPKPTAQPNTADYEDPEENPLRKDFDFDFDPDKVEVTSLKKFENL